MDAHALLHVHEISSLFEWFKKTSHLFWSDSHLFLSDSKGNLISFHPYSWDDMISSMFMKSHLFWSDRNLHMWGNTCKRDENNGNIALSSEKSSRFSLLDDTVPNHETVSRLLKIIGLFCKRALYNRRQSRVASIFSCIQKIHLF